MFANCLKNNYVNSLFDVYVLFLILHVPYGNHRKMLRLTCLNKFLCMYVCTFGRALTLFTENREVKGDCSDDCPLTECLSGFHTSKISHLVNKMNDWIKRIDLSAN